MPWKKSDGTYIKEGKAWVGTDGTKYPAVWTRFSDDELKTFGLSWEDPPAVETPYDNRFYWGRKANGSLIEKSLTDINVVDEDGKAVIDPITGKQEVTLGLKSIWINQTKRTTQEKLNKHDWMITRKAEKGTAISSDVTTYRDKVRTACNTIETKINDCSDFASFVKLFDTPSDGSNAPINDFPDEI